MLKISQRLDVSRPVDVRLVLPFQLRSKSRLRTALDDGEEVGVVIERGTMLRGGDQLLAEDGRVVEVVAAPETVSTVRAVNGESLARAAYHLGNRHVALQIGADWLRYQHDHVLDEMVSGLGFQLAIEEQPFEPEAGAYSHGQSHVHSLAPHGHG